MHGLIIVESTPPHVTPQAEAAVLDRALTEGIMPLTQDGLTLLQDHHEPLARYLDEFGFDLNRYSGEGIWPERILKIGAAISALAYHEAGYTEPVNPDIFVVGTQKALETGVPDAFAISLTLDRRLASLVETIQETRHIQEIALDKRHMGGIAQVASLGAGCVRHYFQEALAAAA